MGGNVTIIYSRGSLTCPILRATSHPTEVQIRSADGQFVMRTTFSYYTKGRVTVAREHNILFDKTTSGLCNDRGDCIRGRTTFKHNSLPEGSERSYLFQDRDALCNYQYDSHGNWTEATGLTLTDLLQTPVAPVAF